MRTLSVIRLIGFYDECHKYVYYAECRYAECHYAECHGARKKSIRKATPTL